MTVNNSLKLPNRNSALKKGILKRITQIFIQLLILAAILFLASGRLDWRMAWVYLGIYVIAITVTAFLLFRKNPELIAERAEIKAGTKAWDKVLGALYIIMASLLLLLVCGLDMRFGWSPRIPAMLKLMALVIGVLGFSFATWAMVTNAFFSGTVRIQKERGHTVVSDGPYRFVRHPGYAGWTIFNIATPIMLGSWWSLAVTGLATLILIIRTALEDKTLRNELDGYTAYAERVRYRLIPGIW